MLLIAQHITDYSDIINLSTTDHPSCVDQFHNHDHHIATMECIVAYALLIRLYEYGPRIRRHRCFPPAQIAHRKKAYEMLLIFRNESVKPMEAQKNMISSRWYDVIVSVKDAAINHAKSPLVFEDGPWSRPLLQILCREMSYEMLLILNNESVKPMDTQQAVIDILLKRLVFGHIFYDPLVVVIISKLFPDFVHRWDNVAFSVEPAKSCFGSWSSSSWSIMEDDCTIEGGDQKVMDTLLVFSACWSICSLSIWDDDKESVENEEDSGGFKESENLLAMASAPRDLPDHHRSLFSSRKGGVDRSVVEEKSSHDKGSQAHRRR
ncbi:hypothetical protein Syun_008036 [Stephania yunnanensis]|uniref:Uncharacterized protein n=1 Tax=Stephania yunnanensis TaxID=152371 RepID=A0AAP0PZV0_9MAGN